jgi:hypothetical protein
VFWGLFEGSLFLELEYSNSFGTYEGMVNSLMLNVSKVCATLWTRATYGATHTGGRRYTESHAFVAREGDKV